MEGDIGRFGHWRCTDCIIRLNGGCNSRCATCEEHMSDHSCRAWDEMEAELGA
jgi:hypothetical protein